MARGARTVEGAQAGPVRKTRVRKAATPPPAPVRPPCANCATPLIGQYCHECGQQAHLHNKLKDLLHEFVEGIAHFDGRLWRTLPNLILNPGRLSRDWIEGRRVRYVAPLHLYLFAFFLFFTIPALTGIRWQPDAQVNGVQAPKDPAAREAFFREQQAAINQALAEDEAKRQAKARAGAPEKPGLLDKVMAKLAPKLAHMDFYQYKIQNLAYKLSFLLAPLSMAVLWLLLFYKRGVTLYDHGVVALYGLGFLALMGSIRGLLPGDLGEIWVLVMMIVAPIHAVRHLKVAYAMGWPAAIGLGLVMGLLTLAILFLFFIGVASLILLV